MRNSTSGIRAQVLIGCLVLVFTAFAGCTPTTQPDKSKDVSAKKVSLGAGVSKVVKPDSLIEVNYAEMLVNGKVFMSTQGKGPLGCKVGECRFPKVVEDSLVGMKLGEKKRIVVLPEQAYGLRNEALVRAFPLTILKGKAVNEGQLITISDNSGHTIHAMVKSVEKDKVILDLNHPLAGQTIVYDIQIAGIK